TAEHLLDLVVEIHKDSEWFKANGLGRNLKVTARANRIMGGQRIPVGVTTEESDVARNLTYLSRASANDYVHPAFFVPMPEVFEYFDEDSPQSLLGHQDIALGLRDMGLASAIDEAAKMGRIPKKLPYGFAV